MSSSTQFAVLGLGRFGQGVVRTLVDNGCDVLACDMNGDLVSEVASYATQVVQVNVTDEKALASLGLGNFDVVIVAIGSDLQSSIMAIMIAKDLGAKFILAKANHYLEKKILEKIGADRVVLPEREMGAKIAINLITKNAIDFIRISDEHGIVEMDPLPEWIGKSLKNAHIRANTGLTVIGIKHGDDKVKISPKPEDIISEGDTLMVVGETKDIIHANVKTEGGFGGFFHKKLL